MFDATVTVYNKYRDESVEKWQRTTLRGVSWNDLAGATMRKTGRMPENSLQLIIPAGASVEDDRTYLKPKAFAASDDKTSYWTLAPGDTVVLGELDVEIISSAAKELVSYDDARTIVSVDSFDFGGNLAHWEVVGK